jgi:hypothetical protein
LDHALKRVFGSAKLRPYERAVLDAWRDRLPDDARAILGTQLALYDYVQRQSAGKVTCFFCLRDRECSTWPADAFFPLRTTEDTPVARLTLARIDEQKKTHLRAEIVIGDGRLLSIDFNRRPVMVFPKEVRLRGVAVTNLELFVDPMSPDPYRTEALVDANRLRGWLREWVETWELSDLREPLPPALRRELVGRLDSTLPPDYLELVEQTEGAQVHHCKVNGLTQVWTFPWPDESFYILADIEGRGAVGVRQGDSDGVLHYLGNEEDEAQAVGISLRAVIEKELELRRREEAADR